MSVSKRPAILIAMILGCGALLGFGITYDRVDPADSYSWDVVSQGEIRETVQASGEIQANVRINIGTNVSGEIKAIHVRDGQDVKAGQPLVTIDPVRIEQQLRQAQAQLEVARADAARLEAVMRRASENAKRTESLFVDGLVSDEDFRQAKLAEESAQLNYQSARANILQNQASVAVMRDSLEKTVIVAPIAGRVTALRAQMGEMAIQGVSNLPGATLMVISDMHEINAELQVNESEVVRLKLGQAVQVNVESLPGRVFLGKVYEIASAAERTGRNANMYTVKVALSNSSPDIEVLRPGMSARGTILTADVKEALYVPIQAVLERDGSLEEALKKGLLAPEARAVVMVVRDDKAVERPIETGIANTQFYQVIEGLSEGERVLTGPSRKLKKLRDGASLRLREKSDTEIAQEANKAVSS